MCMMSILYMAEDRQSRLVHVQLVHIAATVYAGARAVVDRPGYWGSLSRRMQDRNR